MSGSCTKSFPQDNPGNLKSVRRSVAAHWDAQQQRTFQFTHLQEIISSRTGAACFAPTVLRAASQAASMLTSGVKTIPHRPFTKADPRASAAAAHRSRSGTPQGVSAVDQHHQGHHPHLGQAAPGAAQQTHQSRFIQHNAHDLQTRRSYGPQQGHLPPALVLTHPPTPVIISEHSSVAQSAEQPAVNRLVVGSSPTRGA
jgi:hypothetical protein